MPGIGVGEVLVLVAVGSAAGLLSGVVGMGGAILLVPVLAFAVGMPFKDATGAAALHGLGVGLFAYLVHGRRGAVDARLGLIAGGASVAGGLLGAGISGALDPNGVKLVYVGAVLFALGLLVARREVAISAPAAPVSAPGPKAAGAGGVTGVLAGIIGAGGGFLLVPLFRWALHLPIHRAIGTSMLVVIFTAFAATAGKALLGQVPLPQALFVVAGSAFGSQLGARLSHRIPARPLRWLLILLLVALLLRTAADALLTPAS